MIRNTNRKKQNIIIVTCCILLFLVIYNLSLPFFTILILGNVEENKKAEKFVDLTYGENYFKEKKEDLNNIINIVSESDITIIAKYSLEFKAKKGYEYDSNNYKSNKKYANDISSILSANKWEGVKKTELDNSCVLYKITIVSTINNSVSYIYSDKEECLEEKYMEEEKYNHINFWRIKKIDTHWLFEYNGIPSI